jgi:ABC-type transport system involved in cytochrome bd biosynthesis fused ATPase/permease subunit
MRSNAVSVARAAFVALVTMIGLSLSVPAFADGGSSTYNDASVDIHGGNAAAFGGCMNYAKAAAKVGRPAKSNACKSFAHADGGNVELTGVSVFVDQEGSGRHTHNNVNIDISGGDAVAVAGCVNYLQGSTKSEDANTCKTAADAHGGNVDLKDVDITVIQLG